MTIGSLFSGIGGLELGLELCGHGPILWQCDSDPYARAVLGAHWPAVHRYADVRDIDAKAPRPDLICGGFPCQPVSVAGKRKAQSDARWLWPFFAGVIARLAPRYVFIENVPGLRTAGLRDVLSDLAGLGYDAEWDHFTAAETGAPHIRRRLFLLAHAHGHGLRQQPGRQRRKGRQSEDVATADGQEGDAAHAHRKGGPIGAQRGWAGYGDGGMPEPVLRRGYDGVPNRMDRERLLGNACVPAQAALAFRTLMERI